MSAALENVGLDYSEHVVFERHALERYQEHYPAADADDLRLAIRFGEEVAPELAAVMLGRRRIDRQTRYVLSSDRRGMFVLIAGRIGWKAITYLRLGIAQREFAFKHWPLPDAADDLPRYTVAGAASRQKEYSWLLNCCLTEVEVLPRLKQIFGKARHARAALLDSVVIEQPVEDYVVFGYERLEIAAKRNRRGQWSIGLRTENRQ